MVEIGSVTAVILMSSSLCGWWWWWGFSHFHVTPNFWVEEGLWQYWAEQNQNNQVLIKFIVYLRWSQISVYTNIKIFLSLEKGQWRRFWTAWKGSNGQPREGLILYQQWQEPNMKPSTIWNILQMVYNANFKMQWLNLNWRIDSNYTSI